MIVFIGTHEGSQLCEFLTGNGIPVTLAIATEYDAFVLSSMPLLSEKEERIPLEGVIRLVEDFDWIIDATHPYARGMMQNIWEAAARHRKKYLRVIVPPPDDEKIVVFSDLSCACTYLNGTSGNILVTTGSENILPLTSIENYKQRVFMQVLPTVEDIEACSRQQFSGSQLLCLQGPLCENMYKAMLEQTDARFLVTKEGRQDAGFLEALSAARPLGVQVVVIGQPYKEEGMALEEACLYLGQAFGIRHRALPAGISCVQPKTEAGSCMEEEGLSHFPMFISVRRRKVIVVGGGRVATRRIEVLLRFGADITVIAPRCSETILRLYKENKLELKIKNYASGDLQDAFAVIAATDRREVNAQVSDDARSVGAFVNVSDRKEACDFFFPAVFEDEEIIGGLISKAGSGHRSAKEKASRIRDSLKHGRRP